MDSITFQKNEALSKNRVLKGLPRIRYVLSRLESCSQSNLKQKPSWHNPIENQKIVVKCQLMKQVAVLTTGQYFGQDSLDCESAQKRNATCQATNDEKVFVAILMKNDFLRIFSEQQRINEHLSISQIIQFDIFRKLRLSKMKQNFDLFYDPKTQGNFVKKRG